MREEASTMANPNQSARNSRNGHYMRTPDTVARDAQAANLRSKGRTYAQIAEELGYYDRGKAHAAVQRAIQEIVKEPAEAVLHFELERLDAELGRLDALEEKARAVLNTRHITVNNGHVIIHPETGEPMEDDDPVLRAIDRLLKIEEARRRNGERRAKLTGIEAAVKIDATVHEVTQQDLELQEMLREARAAVDSEEQQIRDGGEE
ncbi:hypothetical protein [Streptomyces sp. NPDC005799]|uniref:hypothetical protein n=1 Tax=Streptomyces sp. NPDC005799 TaxID=3154678 RepID=UPI0033E1F936